MAPPTNGIPWALWRTTLSTWAQMSGLPIVWARQEVNPPQRPPTYALLDIVSFEQIGFDEQQYVYNASTGKLQENLLGIRELVLNVQVFAPATGKWEDSAWPWIEDLQSSFGRTEVQVLLTSVGLARSDASVARDISSLEGVQFNSRVTLDFTFNAAFYRQDPVGGPAVTRVVGSGDLEDNPGDEVDFDVTGP